MFDSRDQEIIRVMRERWACVVQAIRKIPPEQRTLFQQRAIARADDADLSAVLAAGEVDQLERWWALS